MKEKTSIQPLSRRSFIRDCAATAALLQSSGLASFAAAETPFSDRVQPLDDGWSLRKQAELASSGGMGAASIRLPHAVVPLSWKNWDPASWQDVWVYRRQFSLPAAWRGQRLFLHFERVMAAATVSVNGHALPQHSGGFLPFEREITGLIHESNNLLEVVVDARWLNIPPAGSPRGPVAVDYLLPGGITGSVQLQALPNIFLREVFAKAMDVLSPDRRLEIICRTDAASSLPADVHLSATLRQGNRTVATVSKTQTINRQDQETTLTLGGLRDIELWSIDQPHLYSVDVTLSLEGKPLHRRSTRVGFREARFDVDGFYLNGKRTRIFGLNRHELYPYVGFAVPSRLLRRDAEILRRQFNCNMVRCSHYPQSEAFLDACDELGLMVWQEPPGWQYIGDESWQDLALGDVEAMVRRDRNHPAIVIWGVRINESRNDPALYQKTRALAKSLDGTRPTSGSMTPSSRNGWKTEWHQDVFAFDDYHADPVGSVGIDAPLPGVPYLITEAVGQFDYFAGKRFDLTYRRAGDVKVQTGQALFHAEAHDKAASFPRCAGLIAWCAFDYASLMNAWNTVKCPGVADVFRQPKLGAAFYLSQVDPAVRAVIEPSFYWDFDPAAAAGLSEHAAIFSNCERLELLIDGKSWATLHADRAGFPNLTYPPFFADFSSMKRDANQFPHLRIDGYVGSTRVLSRSFSSDRSRDQLSLLVDDRELNSSVSDATRLAFAAVDEFGAPRAFVTGEVTLHIEGPGEIVGDNPFQIGDNGGSGAVWVKPASGANGVIRIQAAHPVLGTKSVSIQVRASAVRRSSEDFPITAP